MTKTITTKDTFGKSRSYEVVEKIPSGFFVWNIGENMGSDEYIPICEDLPPEDKDNYEINPNTVKAIKLSVEEVKVLRKAAHVGIVSKKTAEKALKALYAVIVTVFGILLTIPLVSSASSTGERLETRNAVIIVLALLELVHLQTKTDCTRKDSRKSQNIKIWR